MTLLSFECRTCGARQESTRTPDCAGTPEAPHRPAPMSALPVNVGKMHRRKSAHRRPQEPESAFLPGFEQ